MRFHANSRALRLLLLFSDTGGGHRSAAEALIETWHTEYPGSVQIDLVDAFRDYSPFPLNLAGPSYPLTIKYLCPLWLASYRTSDGPCRAEAVARAVYRYVRPHLYRLLTEHPANAIVSVHPLFNHCVNWALHDMGLRLPYITVVTDLFTAHAFWFYPEVCRIIVPTEGARDRAIRLGVPASRVAVHGLPVARRFTENLGVMQDRARLRVQLGLAPQGRVVLLAGGGDGMGPLERLASTLDTALPMDHPLTQIVVITGRNAALRSRLQARTWRHPFRAEGFVRNMADWMAAADILVTKAGPGTITEGLLSGLPLILISKVPGQEDGNVDFITSSGVGAWEPDLAGAAARIKNWLEPGNPAGDPRPPFGSAGCRQEHRSRHPRAGRRTSGERRHQHTSSTSPLGQDCP
jgi:1,2-diacylglycerol 3-beta-galactosyltransferase